MSDVVKQISDALVTTIGTTLPDYQVLDYAYFPEKNQFYGNTKRYGVTVDAGSSFPTITKAISIDQTFNVQFVNDYSAHDDEKNLTAQILELHDSIQEVYIDVFNSKLGLPNLVYNINPIGFTAPLIDQEQQTILITLALSIQYRTLLI